MSTIVAGITVSVDGYITGPDDGPARTRFTRSLDLEHLGVTQSPFATFIRYRVRQAG